MKHTIPALAPSLQKRDPAWLKKQNVTERTQAFKLEKWLQMAQSEGVARREGLPWAWVRFEKRTQAWPSGRMTPARSDGV
jgi:hypothetical protein